MAKLRLVYENSGEPISDFDVFDWLLTVVKDANSSDDEWVEYGIGNYVCINAIQLAILRGMITHTDVILFYDGVEYKFSENGLVENKPSTLGPYSHLMKEIATLLMAAQCRPTVNPPPPSGG